MSRFKVGCYYRDPDNNEFLFKIVKIFNNKIGYTHVNSDEPNKIGYFYVHSYFYNELVLDSEATFYDSLVKLK